MQKTPNGPCAKRNPEPVCRPSGCVLSNASVQSCCPRPPTHSKITRVVPSICKCAVSGKPTQRDLTVHLQACPTDVTWATCNTARTQRYQHTAFSSKFCIRRTYRRPTDQNVMAHLVEVKDGNRFPNHVHHPEPQSLHRVPA